MRRQCKGIIECVPDGSSLFCIKTDGSLDDGLEIVTHPMTFDFHRGGTNWHKVTQKAVSLGYLSHKTSTCGLHVHVNRVTRQYRG